MKNCLHCGKPLGTKAKLEAKFCCDGCERVYTYLNEVGLTDYYHMVDTLGDKVPTGVEVLNEGEFEVSLETLSSIFRHEERGCYLFYIPNLRCAACLWLIPKVLQNACGIQTCELNLDEKTLAIGGNVEFDIKKVLLTLSQIGYRASPYRDALKQAVDSAALRDARKELGIAAVAFANVMLFSAANYFGELWGIERLYETLFMWLSFAVTSASLWLGSKSLIMGAWTSLRTRTLGIDLPIVIAITVAYLVSVVNVLAGKNEVYFDSITGLAFFLLTGRYLQNVLLERARRLASSMLGLLPLRALEVQKDDFVLVRAGEVFPADGIVENGTTEISEAPLTGESLPVTKLVGDTVYAGTINISAPVRMRCDKVGDETRMARYIAKVTEQAGRESRFRVLSDKVLPWFVFFTIVVAGAGFVLWWPRGAQPAFHVFVSLLIVSCPCAFALAVPLANSFSLRRAWKNGVIVKRASVFEEFCRVDTVVLDKTGTVTSGELRVLRCVDRHADDGFLEALASGASQSNHPVSRAVSTSLFGRAKERKVNVEEVAGCGLRIEDGGELIYLGKPSWVEKVLSTEVKSLREFVSSIRFDHWVLGASSTGKLRAFLLADDVLAEVRDLVSDWQKQGMRVLLATGDEANVAHAVGKELRIFPGDVRANLMPEDKVALVEELKAQGRTVMFVGDGINDAAAIRASHIGASVRGGLDIALAVSDVFLETDIGRLADFRNFSFYVRNTLRLVIGLSILYNVVAVSFSLAGFIHPFVAALIMPLASLTVILISFLRKGGHLWTPSSSSCRYPRSLPLVPLSSTGGPKEMASSTT